ncbi:MAG: 23S rRNA (guanosine(2251)-2'-O)-methyltransferase RlmB [Xanthomonadales bacterium]|nr:23S rRNA (guanosine(2251)-2'-O)-methyltransferase RlmB [Xanthomonadales bacterium]
MADWDWVIGINAVQEVLSAAPERVLEVQVADRRASRLETLLAEAGRHSISLQDVRARDLDRRFPDQRHQGVAARVRPAPLMDEADLVALVESTEDFTALVLDQIQDPRNFGACLRSAAAMGVSAVVFPRDRSASLTPVARKAAAGAADRLRLVQVTNLARALGQLKDAGVWLVGADGSAEQPLWDVDLTGRIAIVVGSEGSGLRRLTADHCDFLARIPMAGGFESLNVSVAAGIFLAEMARQRTKVKR